MAAMPAKPTRADLFGFLNSLGFRRVTGVSVAYFHEPTDTLLLFPSSDEHGTMAAADLLSAEVRLRQNGLIDQPLLKLLRQRAARGDPTT